MTQKTRYLVTCWVGAYALAVACYITGGHMSALTTGFAACAATVMLVAAQKMVAKKGGVK